MAALLRRRRAPRSGAPGDARSGPRSTATGSRGRIEPPPAPAPGGLLELGARPRRGRRARGRRARRRRRRPQQLGRGARPVHRGLVARPARRHQRAQGVEVPGHRLPRQRGPARCGDAFADADMDGDGVRDGADDHDHDGLTNQFEVRRPGDWSRTPWSGGLALRPAPTRGPTRTRSTPASPSTPSAATATRRSATTTTDEVPPIGPDPPGRLPRRRTRPPRTAERRGRGPASRVWSAMALRFTTAGESHGPGLTAVVEGLPAGLEVTPEDIDRDLARRQLGHGRGGRMKIENDRAEVTSGVRHGRTLGSPVALRIANRDYANWEERMNPWPVDGEVEEVHLPRPGHADLAGRAEVRLHRRAQRARARQRPRDRRAGGGRRRWPRCSCARSGVEVRSHVLADRLACARPRATSLGSADFDGVDESPVRCLDADASEAMVAEIDARPQGQRVARRRLRGARLRAGAGNRLARVLGGAAGRPARAGDHVDPGDEGRRRSATGSTWPAASAREAHDEIFFSEERGLLPRDQPRRRPRGRHDQRRPARRARAR